MPDAGAPRDDDGGSMMSMPDGAVMPLPDAATGGGFDAGSGGTGNDAGYTASGTIEGTVVGPATLDGADIGLC